MVKKRETDSSLMIVAVVAIVAIVVLVTSLGSSSGGVGLSTDNLFDERSNIAGQKFLPGKDIEIKGVFKEVKKSGGRSRSVKKVEPVKIKEVELIEEPVKEETPTEKIKEEEPVKEETPTGR